MRKNFLRIAIVGIVLSAAIGAFLWIERDEAQEIVVFLPSAENPFWIEVRRGVEEAAAKLDQNYKVTTMASGDLNAASQIEQLNSVLARGMVDAIVIGVANNRAPAAIISKYNKENIPVVMIDTKLDEGAVAETGAAWDAFIGSDNRLGGERAAEAMANALSGKENRVLLIKGSYVHQSAIDRAEGFIDGADGRFEIVEREGEWSRQRATEITTGVMTREPVDGIFASNDDMALGAVAALHNLGITGEGAPIVIGFDATPAGLDAIQRGDLYASVKQDARGMGSTGVSLAVALLEGSSELPRETLIPVNVVPERRAE